MMSGEISCSGLLFRAIFDTYNETDERLAEDKPQDTANTKSHAQQIGYDTDGAVAENEREVGKTELDGDEED